MKKIYLLLLLAFCFGPNRVMAQACTGTPTVGTISATATSGCGTYTSVLSLPALNGITGLTYAWYMSTDNFTFNPAPGANTNATYTASVTGTTYYECTITCTTSTQYASTPSYTLTAGATAGIPYSEGFEGISTANTLPSCMAATSLGTNELTYTSAQTPSLGRVAHAGSRYAVFASSASNDYFYTPAFSLTAGTPYQFSFWYVTDGFNTWNLSVNYGSLQTAAAMTGTVTGNALTNLTNTTYTQYTCTITPTSSGVYFIGIHSTSANGNNFYMSIDDLGLINLSPNISISPTTLNFGNLGVGVTSAAQTFSVSASYLGGAPGTITVNAPTNYSISNSVTGTYASSASISYTTSTLTNVPLWIEFTPPSVGTYTGTVTITPTGGVANPGILTVTGSGVGACSPPTDQPTGLSFSGTLSNTTSATFSDAVAATNYILVASNGAFTGTLTNGTTYALNAAVGNGTVVATYATPTLNIGTAISPTVTVTGLTPNSTNTITVFPSNSYTTCVGPVYNIIAPLSGSVSTCLAPPIISLSSMNSGSLGLSWTTSTGATNYIVNVTAAGVPIPGSPFTVAAPTTSLTVSGLSTSTTYAYSVTATGGNCNSLPATGSSTPSVFTLVPVTGFNYDVIANGVGAPATTTTVGTAGFDLGGYSFVAQDYSDPGGVAPTTPTGGAYLVNGGLLSSSPTAGLKWQLANYNANNCLRLLVNQTGTLSFPTPLYASTVYMLSASGNGPATANFKVFFADGTSQLFTNISITDWGTNSGPAVSNIGRVSSSDGHTQSGFYLFQQALALSATNQVKQVDSIVIEESGGTSSKSGIFAVSIRDGDMTASTNSLSFATTPNCSATAAQVFSVSGTNLYPTAGSIIVNAPAGFLVSNSNAGTYSATTTLTYAGNAMTNVPVYVEFSPVAGGNISGNITFSGGTVNFAPSIAVSGIATGLAVAPTTTANFGNVTVSTNSASQIYTVTGTVLTTGSVTVTSNDAAFQVSPTGVGGSFGSSFTIANGTSLSATPIYIEFSPSTTGTVTSTIGVSGGGQPCATTINVTGVGVSTGCGTPGTPTSILFTGTNSTGTTVNFTPNGAPDAYLVIASPTTFVGTVSNGTIYANGATIGNGTVVGNYTSAALPINFTGQNGNTAYRITIYAYNGGNYSNCGNGPVYSLTNLAGSYTTCPAAPTPVTVTSVTTNTLTLNWPSSTGGGASPITYTIQVATDAAFTNTITGSPFTTAATSLPLTGLSAGIIYYYNIVANGSCTSTSIIGNTSTTAITYACAPSYVDGCGSWYMSSLTGAGLAFNGAGCNAPNQTSQIATVVAGNITSLTAVTQGYTGLGIWTDLNNDGTFEDNENLFHQYLAPGTATYNIGLVVPANTTPGYYRMRVVAGWGSDCYGPGGSSTNLTGTNGYGPCGQYAYETYEDFTLRVVGTSYLASADSVTLDSTQLCHTSPAATFTVTPGTIAITPVPGTLTVTAPTGFQVSSDGIAWQNSYTISYSASPITASTVYVDYSPTVQGTTSGYVTITGANGGASVFISATGTAPALVSSVTATTTTYCYNGTPILDTLTDTLAGGAWSSGNSAIASVNSSTGIVTVLGSGTVNITYSVTTCITDTANVILTVNATPTATITPAGPSISICQGDNVTLQTTTGTGISYQWFMNTDTLTGATNSSYAANAAGSYVVVATSSANCTDSTTIPVVVTVNPLPVPVITQTNGNLLSTTIAYSSYQWYINGQLISTATGATYTAPIAGVYTVKVTDANGCSATSVAFIETLGVANVSAGNTVSIYPNPNNGSFTLSGAITSSDNKAQMVITDVTGKVIMTRNLDLNNGILYQQVNMDNSLPAEVYFIKIASDKQTMALPFVKQ